MLVMSGGSGSLQSQFGKCHRQTLALSLAKGERGTYRDVYVPSKGMVLIWCGIGGERWHRVPFRDTIGGIDFTWKPGLPEGAEGPEYRGWNCGTPSLGMFIARRPKRYM